MLPINAYISPIVLYLVNPLYVAEILNKISRPMSDVMHQSYGTGIIDVELRINISRDEQGGWC